MSYSAKPREKTNKPKARQNKQKQKPGVNDAWAVRCRPTESVTGLMLLTIIGPNTMEKCEIVSNSLSMEHEQPL